MIVSYNRLFCITDSVLIMEIIIIFFQDIFMVPQMLYR